MPDLRVLISGCLWGGALWLDSGWMVGVYGGELPPLHFQAA
ncbi:hypothetical protein [Kingella oralis]|nr:hypothetical protein [Kingella oralis]